jgi:LacI family transcriptional regulator
MLRPPTTPRVLIVLDTSTAWSRGVLRGFTEAAHREGWALLRYHPPLDLQWLADVWKPAAFVLQKWVYREFEGTLRACDVVLVNDDGSAEGIASVCLDEQAIGRIAATHLLDKGLRDLTTFRFNDGGFAVAREEGFIEAARAGGARIAPGWWMSGTDPPRYAEDPSAIMAWLEGLPRPSGIFACTDSWARVIARYAQLAGMRVPEELALLGVDNDTVDCELTAPALSSVAVPWRTVGEKAAELVAQALSGRGTKGKRVVLGPVDVIPRRSTDVTSVNDPLVERTLSWIAEHAGRRLTLQTIARAVGSSRQRLEQRFRASTGRTVMQELRRTRVDMAKRFLSTTELSLPAIAARCGFTSAALLSVSFRATTGVPPGAYRRRLQGLHTVEE